MKPQWADWGIGDTTVGRFLVWDVYNDPGDRRRINPLSVEG